MWPEVRIIAGIEASTMTSLGTCRLVMPLSESTIASAGPSASPCSTAALIAWRRLAADLLGAREDAAETVVGVEAGLEQRVAVLGEQRREERLHHVAEDDRVGDLHHRGLEVHREQHVVGLGPRDLRGRNSCSAATRMKVASTTSPARTGTDSRSTSVPPSVDRARSRSAPSSSIDHRLLVGAEVVGRPCARRWSWSRRSTRPSSAGACGRSSSPTRARGGRSCPRAAPG